MADREEAPAEGAHSPVCRAVGGQTSQRKRLPRIPFRRQLEAWSASNRDIMVITEAGTLAPDLLDPGVTLPESVTWQRRGARVANGDLLLPNGLHVDVWSAKPESRGAM